MVQRGQRGGRQHVDMMQPPSQFDRALQVRHHSPGQRDLGRPEAEGRCGPEQIDGVMNAGRLHRYRQAKPMIHVARPPILLIHAGTVEDPGRHDFRRMDDLAGIPKVLTLVEHAVAEQRSGAIAAS